VQLRLIDAPCIVANVDGYYDALIALIDGAVANGFIHARTRAIVESYDDLAAVVDRLRRRGADGG
jgi:predicted Rossmann-fold nucleotide-binding protein